MQRCVWQDSAKGLVQLEESKEGRNKEDMSGSGHLKDPALGSEGNGKRSGVILLRVLKNPSLCCGEYTIVRKRIEELGP